MRLNERSLNQGLSSQAQWNLNCHCKREAGRLEKEKIRVMKEAGRSEVLCRWRKAPRAREFYHLEKARK